MRETNDGALAQAAKRLDRAISKLEAALAKAPMSGERDLFDRDRAELAAQLDAARARERALEEAAAAASGALGRAAEEVRLAIGDDDADELGDEIGAEVFEEMPDGDAADAGEETPAPADGEEAA